MDAHTFKGTFLGNGHTIANVVEPQVTTSFQSYTGFGLFGYCLAKLDTTITIKDLNIEMTLPGKAISYEYAGLFSYVKPSYSSNGHFINIENVNINYNVNGYIKYSSSDNYISIPAFGGLVSFISATPAKYVVISNCNVTYSASIETSNDSSDFKCTIGGIVGYGSATIKNCNVTGFGVKFGNLSSDLESFCAGGLIGYIENQGYVISGNYVEFGCELPYNSWTWYAENAMACVGGLVGRTDTYGTMTENYANISLNAYQIKDLRMGGLIGFNGGNLQSYNNLAQGTISINTCGDKTKSLYGVVGGLVGWGYSILNSSNNNWTGLDTQCFFNNISNVTINNTASSYSDSAYIIDGLISDTNYLKKLYPQGNNLYNSSTFSAGTDNLRGSTYGATSDANMKLASTYAGWTDFDEHWIIDSKTNNGYPMLRAFIPIAQVTGFDGDGTENNPYLIKTHQDMLGVASYYNDNNLTKGNIYWKVANDIDMSVDANDMLIHFTPICYAKEFDGYFDGNNKTISGLLIDNQYEYTGLFGTIGASHYVKNLTIKGNIYWDEAYAVGGVAGRVLAGGHLQNCHFEGNIIGVLNTKSSTETNGVVGKFEIDGVIDSTATYTDLKYAKIGGTTDAPTYTYYLYDWAQIKTYLYDKKVG